MISIDSKKLYELIAKKKGVPVHTIANGSTMVTGIEVQLFMLAKGCNALDDMADDNILSGYAADYFDLKQKPFSREYLETLSDMKGALADIEALMGDSDMTPALEQYMDDVQMWRSVIAEEEENSQKLEQEKREKLERERVHKTIKAAQKAEMDKIKEFRYDEYRAEHEFKQDYLDELRSKYPNIQEIQSARHIQDIENAAVSLNDRLANTPKTDSSYGALSERAELLTAVAEHARQSADNYASRNMKNAYNQSREMTQEHITQAAQKLDRCFEVFQKKAEALYAQKPKVVRKTLDEIIKERSPEKAELKPVERVKKEPVKERTLGK